MSKENPPRRQREARRTRDPETKASVSYPLPLLLFSGHEQPRQTEMAGTKVGKSINRHTETHFRVISHLPWSPASHACHSKRQTHLESEMEPLRRQPHGDERGPHSLKSALITGLNHRSQPYAAPLVTGPTSSILNVFLSTPQSIIGSSSLPS